MKKRIIGIMMALLLCTANVSMGIADTTIVSEAHPGRTDANGGHRDNKNKSGLGSYHYHCGGNPAHLHEGGICPYAGGVQTPAQEVIIQPVPEQADGTSAVFAADAAAIESVIYNTAFYAAANPDVVQLVGTDAQALYQHFVTSGMAEGRQGAATFNVQVYIASNPDLAAVLGNDLPAYYNHYLLQGQFEGRRAY